jgi:hypothetical protein
LKLNAVAIDNPSQKKRSAKIAKIQKWRVVNNKIDPPFIPLTFSKYKMASWAKTGHLSSVESG